jgi:hypothetical protein
MFILSILFALAPFGFGTIRALQANDFRLLWMAVASCIGAAASIAFVRRREAEATGVFRSSATVFFISALFAALAGMLLGATSGPGTVMVAIVLGLCWAASYALYTLSRARPI